MNKKIEKEVWKDVEGFEGFYQVSSLGRVKSLQRIIVRRNGVKVHYDQRILQPSQDNIGYLHVRLAKNSVYTLFKVHRLVAKTFLPTYSQQLTVNHIDHVKTNNKLSNLQMCTLFQNIRQRSHRKIYYCKELNLYIAQPKRLLHKLGIPHDQYRLYQCINKKTQYLNTGLHFQYKQK